MSKEILAGGRIRLRNEKGVGERRDFEAIRIGAGHRRQKNVSKTKTPISGFR